MAKKRSKAGEKRVSILNTQENITKREQRLKENRLKELDRSQIVLSETIKKIDDIKNGINRAPIASELPHYSDILAQANEIRRNVNRTIAILPFTEKPPTVNTG